MHRKPPTADDVAVARHRIRDIATRTPVRDSQLLSRAAGGPVTLKLETVQPTGAFKVRGAANAILCARERGPVAGVVTASTGNHGIAVAYVARLLGLPAIVCVSGAVGADRIAAIEAYGATIERAGDDQTAAIETAQSLAGERELLMLPPFDHPDVISGAGTIGAELLEQCPDAETVLVPVSGGGLAAGVGLAVKAIDPAVRVVGVGAERAPALRDSVRAGRPVPTNERPTVAASLMGDLGPANAYTLDLVRRHVDDIVLVPEHEILDAMSWALLEERLVLEGAAAVPIAHVRRRPPELTGRHTVAVVTGDNADRDDLRRAATALRLS